MGTKDIERNWNGLTQSSTTYSGGAMFSELMTWWYSNERPPYAGERWDSLIRRQLRVLPMPKKLRRQ
jgi:hypothetical protein